MPDTMGNPLVENEVQVPAGDCAGQGELCLSLAEVESASCLLSRARIVVNRRWVLALALDKGTAMVENTIYGFGAACH